MCTCTCNMITIHNLNHTLFSTLLKLNSVDGSILSDFDVFSTGVGVVGDTALVGVLLMVIVGVKVESLLELLLVFVLPDLT